MTALPLSALLSNWEDKLPLAAPRPEPVTPEGEWCDGCSEFRPRVFLGLCDDCLEGEDE